MRVHGLAGLMAVGVLSATVFAEAPAERGVEVIVPGNAYVKQWEREGYDQFLDIGVKQRDGRQVIVAEMRVESWGGFVATVAEVELGPYDAPLLAFDGAGMPELVSLAGMRQLRSQSLLLDAILEADDVQFPVLEGNGVLTPCEAMAPLIFTGPWQSEDCSVSCRPEPYRERCIQFVLNCGLCDRLVIWCPGGQYGAITMNLCTCLEIIIQDGVPVSALNPFADCPDYMITNPNFILGPIP